MSNWREIEDLNGVKRSVNSFAESEYEPPQRDMKQEPPHWMPGSDGGYIEAPAHSESHRAKDMVFRGIGRESKGNFGRTQAMTFPSDLLPRSERISRNPKDE